MLSARRILLVAPPEACTALATPLRDEGCHVAHAPPGGEAVQAALNAIPPIDVLVLDAAQPDGRQRDSLAHDGAGHHAADLCTRLRRAGVAVPILVVLDEADDAVVACLEAGANDCIARPVRARELAARIRAQLRLHAGSASAVLRIGPFLLHPTRRLLESDEAGRTVRLTATETAILKYLYRAGGETVPRPVLLRQVWGYSAGVTTHTVETHIYRLRRKMEPEAGRFALLVSDDDGYRLNLTWRAPPPPPALAARALSGGG